MKSGSKKTPPNPGVKPAVKTLNRKNELSEAKRLLQVEAALEKVRVKALQMKRSDELKEVIAIIFKEMGKLGFELYDTNIGIVDKATNDITFYGSGLGGVELPPEFKVPYLPGEEPYFDQVYKDIKRRKRFRSTKLEGERLQEYHKFVLEKTDFKNAPKDYLEEMLSVKKVILSYATMSHGILEVAGDDELDQEKINILKRFGRVVDLTYTRFDDLQKAEAQTREAQIEAALERVRARALAMHSSKELIDVANVLREQMELLGQPELATCAIHLYKKESDTFDSWYASVQPTGSKKRLLTGVATFRVHSTHVARELVKKFNSGEKEYTLKFKGAKNKEWLEELKKVIPAMKEEFRGKLPDQQICHLSEFSGGALVMVSHQEFSNELKSLQHKAASVFDLAYKRFLDLQKAEAQTREAQIEAALERVRSRTMAMQDSNELQEVAALMYQEFIDLGFDQVGQCGYAIIDVINNHQKMWLTQFDGNPMTHFNLPLKGDPLLNNRFNAWKSKKPFLYQKVKKSEFSKHLRGVQSGLSKEQIEMARQNMPNPIHFYNANFNHGYLHVVANRQLNTDQESILLRFTLVFKQTYARFLDLKKAEAQTQEAEIQLALERVRARTMAMQHSNELSEAAFLLVKQVRELGINAWGCAFHIYADNEEGDYEWFSNEDGYLPFYKTPRKRFFKKFYDMRESGETLYVIEFKGKACENHYKYLLSLPVVGNALKDLQESGMPLPTSQIDHAAYFKYGYLLFITHEHVPEAHEIFIRFAKEFEQTYIRFLDLKKAEEQAREAEIQLALERVRARTMAMHHSDELAETAVVLSDQLKGLHLMPDNSRVFFSLIDETRDSAQVWMTTPKGDFRNGSHEIPLTQEKELARLYRLWKAKEPLVIRDLKGKKLEAYYQFLRTLPHVANETGFQQLLDNPPERFILTEATHQFGTIGITSFELLSEEAQHILVRFSKVFEQTYTRFLDLQKAEAQAREAEIEAALERMRAQMLAMHSSSDMEKACFLMYEQLNALGVVPESAAVYIAIMDQKTDTAVQWLVSDKTLIQPFDEERTPLTEHELLIETYKGWKQRDPVLIRDLSGKELEEFADYLQSLPWQRESKFESEKLPERMIWTEATFSHGTLGFIHQSPLPEADINILIRFSRVFDLTYQRFLDLQKAEAQAREAEIEAALERVRARTMAMHKSSEMQAVINSVYDQIVNLGIKIDSVNFNIFKADSKDLEVWAGVGCKIYTHPIHLPYIDFGASKEFMVAREKGMKILHKKYSFSEKNRWWQKAMEISDLKHMPEERKKLILEAEGWVTLISIENNSSIQFHRYSNDIFSEKELDIQRRFSKVFEQAYTRFLDLQKAEAQAREAQIEAALERIRASAMAMHSSDGLSEVAAVLREQMAMIGQKELESCLVQLYNKGSKYYTAFYSFKMPNDPDDKMVLDVAKEVPWEKTEWSKQVIANYNSGLDHYTIHADKKMLTEWYQMLAEVSPRTVDYDEKGVLIVPEELYYYFSCFSGGFLSVISYDAPSEETKELLNRAAKTFDMAFRRYLDLQKAEAQAREAKIEAALEKVRGRAMAIRKSEELQEVLSIILDELKKFDFDLYEFNIVIVNQLANELTLWSSGIGEAKLPSSYKIKPWDHPFLTEFLKDYKKGIKYRTYKLSDQSLIDYLDVLFTETEFKKTPDEYKKATYNLDRVYISHAMMKHGALEAAGSEPLPDDKAEILQRFASVVDLTYTRFDDLVQAEAQAREAQIEAALERVRAKAMAMQHSDDLSKSVTTTLDELEKLELRIQRCGVGIFTKKKTAQLWTTTHIGERKQAIVLGELPLTTHPMMKGSYNAWLSKCGYSFVLEGENLRSYYNMLRKEGFPLPEENIKKAMSVERQFYHYFTFPAGGLYVFSEEMLPEQESNIVQRFADVFHIAFTRYLDLQSAESRAKEAIKQASLDRVRGEIASMRTSEDLNRITPVIWNELKVLEVPFFRCGVFIVDDQAKKIDTYLSNPEGESLAAWRSDYEATPLFKASVNAWKKQQVYKTEWNRQQFIEFSRLLIDQGLVSDVQRYQAGKDAPDYLALQMIPFKQGMLYVGSAEKLNDEQIDLAHSLASAFSVAYSRYEDFRQLEKAKAEVEHALIELQATQTQLIHSEKMASLGELTAGIAHEIQNPLNFVNNFSEVSTDLIDELLEEIEEGNLAEVKELTDDIRL